MNELLHATIPYLFQSAPEHTLRERMIRAAESLMAYAELADEPDTLLIHARNWYRVAIGHESPSAARHARNRRKRRRSRDRRGW